jgi:hypothetical protein
MRSPAAAIAWEFRRRHRWGLLALLAYLAALAAVRIFVGRRPVDFDNDQTFALVVVVPLAATFMYFLAVFSFGLSGDLAARQSMYPPRLFTLPVTTAALVRWPMAYGAAAMAALWFATRLLAVWPAGTAVPVVWPALLAASLMAWTQALTWMPYPLPGLRVMVTILWLATIDAVVLLALQYKTPEPVMLAILAPHVPLAYLAARFAVARARRGDVPDWRRLRTARPPRPLAHARGDKAQAWLEWRQHGRSLPAMVAIVLPFELLLLFALREAPVLIFETLMVVLFTPPIMAAFVAGTVSGGMTPFIATRPLTNASIIGAKLKAAMWSTLIAWLLVLAAVPAALRLSGTLPLVLDWAHQLIDILGRPRAIAIALLALAALLASTWKQLVQSLCIGMSGREWLIKTSVFATLSFLAVVVPLAHWIIGSRKAIAMLWNALPWILVVLVCVKLAAAVWVAARLYDRGLLRGRALVIGAIGWDAAVLAVYGLLVWILPTLLFREYFLALIAILAIPLTRLAAAPLALAWNRHR